MRLWAAARQELDSTRSAMIVVTEGFDRARFAAPRPALQSPSMVGSPVMSASDIMAVLDTTTDTKSFDVRSLSDQVSWLAVCADGTEVPDGAELHSRFGGRLLYSLPAIDRADVDRAAQLIAAAATYDLVELYGDRDLTTEILDGIPAHKRMLSWYGGPSSTAKLQEQLDRLSAVPARYYKLEIAAQRPGDAIAPLALLHGLERADVIAFATGPAGAWSRMLAPFFGSPFAVGGVSGAGHGEGVFAVDTLISDYGLPETRRLEHIFGIVGNPALYSLSPLLHNAAYRALGSAALFLPFHTESFDDFWTGIAAADALEPLGLRLGGVTVASPHKERALSVAGDIAPAAARAEAANALTFGNPHWRAETTDPGGLFDLLHARHIDPQGLRIAVVGCGGSGRAMAAALDQAGNDVILVNRGAERGERAHEVLGLPLIRLADFDPGGYAILIHATPVGTHGGAMPFNVDDLATDAIVVDLPYGATETPLMEAVRASGRTAIDGREMLLTQVPRQFELMTGAPMPAGIAEETLARREGR